MKTFYLFRHGETYFSKNRVPYGTNELTATILPENIPTVKKIASYLNSKKIDLGLRSEFLRCSETSKIVESNSNIIFTADPLLNEFIENEFNDFHKRMVTLTSKLDNIKKPSIAICTHGAVIAALQKMLLNKPFHAHELMYYPKTGVVVRIEDKKITEIDLN